MFCTHLRLIEILEILWTGAKRKFTLTFFKTFFCSLNADRVLLVVYEFLRQGYESIGRS